jgi:hypothetical protein
MKKRVLLFVSITFISVLTLGLLFTKPAFTFLSGYLSKSTQVKANILIVEGWLPDVALDKAFEEFRKNGYDYIITTGLKSSSDYYLMSSNGNLIFYTKNRFSEITQFSSHSIDIDAYSELGGDNRAHFNLFVNNYLAADFFAEKRKKTYTLNWKGYLKDIDSIKVQYDNDKWGYFGDRNLFIKQICVDHKITFPYLNNSEYDVINYGRKRRVINNYASNAELTRNRLLAMGLDSSKIIATSGERSRINRTLTSVLAFRDWIKTTKIDIKGINIISMGTHSRRTWMTYNKILKEKYNIGIISVPEPINRYTRENKFFKTIRETLGIIYYWIILIPY